MGEGELFDKSNIIEYIPTVLVQASSYNIFLYALQKS